MAQQENVFWVAQKRLSAGRSSEAGRRSVG
jgi:hypothetical protein